MKQGWRTLLASNLVTDGPESLATADDSAVPLPNPSILSDHPLASV